MDSSEMGMKAHFFTQAHTWFPWERNIEVCINAEIWTLNFDTTSIDIIRVDVVVHPNWAYSFVIEPAHVRAVERYPVAQVDV